MILIEDYPKLLSQELNNSRLQLIYTQKEYIPDPYSGGNKLGKISNLARIII